MAGERERGIKDNSEACVLSSWLHSLRWGELRKEQSSEGVEGRYPESSVKSR